MHKGSCLCGKISILYDGEINELSMCHCNQCRKAQGSAFVAVSPIKTSKLTIDGKDFISEYSTSPGKVRAFCKVCGSPLYSKKDTLPDVIRLRVGLLDTEFEAENRYHKFVSSKASWYELCDDLPKFEKNI